jgi:hypothetical protein
VFVRNSELASEWLSIPSDDIVVFEFFMRNHRQLLRLISTKTFVRELGQSLFDVFAVLAVKTIRPVLSALGLRGHVA